MGDGRNTIIIIKFILKWMGASGVSRQAKSAMREEIMDANGAVRRARISTCESESLTPDCCIVLTSCVHFSWLRSFHVVIGYVLDASSRKLSAQTKHRKLSESVLLSPRRVFYVEMNYGFIPIGRKGERTLPEKASQCGHFRFLSMISQSNGKLEVSDLWVDKSRGGFFAVCKFDHLLRWSYKRFCIQRERVKRVDEMTKQTRVNNEIR